MFRSLVRLFCPAYIWHALNKVSSCGIRKRVLMHLRIDNRYRLHCPVLCRWPTADGYLQNTRGEAHNISPNGIFVLADLCPQVGTLIELKVLLPGLDSAEVGMRLRGKGKVLRVVQSSTTGRNGFAASVRFLMTRPTTPSREEKELGHIQMLNQPLTTQ